MVKLESIDLEISAYSNKMLSFGIYIFKHTQVDKRIVPL